MTNSYSIKNLFHEVRKITSKGKVRIVIVSITLISALFMLLNLTGCIPGMGNQQTYKMDPIWSPQEDKVVFSSNKDGDYDLYIITVESGKIEKLTNNDKNDIGPDWSSDTNRIVFSSDRGGSWQIYSIGADGNDLRQLTVSEESEK